MLPPHEWDTSLALSRTRAVGDPHGGICVWPRSLASALLAAPQCTTRGKIPHSFNPSRNAGALQSHHAQTNPPLRFQCHGGGQTLKVKEWCGGRMSGVCVRFCSQSWTDMPQEVSYSSRSSNHDRLDHRAGFHLGTHLIKHLQAYCIWIFTSLLTKNLAKRNSGPIT